MEEQTPETTTESQPSAWQQITRQGVSQAIYWFKQLFPVVLTVALSVMTYKLCFEPRIVTVDLNKIVSEEIGNARNRGITEEQRASNAERFGRALEKALDNAAQDGRTTVLVSPAVVRGSRDATAAVQQDIRGLMEAQK